MGNALVMMTIAEEMIPVSALRVWNAQGKEVPIPKLAGWPTSRPAWKSIEEVEATLAKNPGAFWMLPVPMNAVWRLPNENGLYDHPERRKAHGVRARASLLRFLNKTLAELDDMIRSGWWVLQKARVKITTFRGRP